MIYFKGEKFTTSCLEIWGTYMMEFLSYQIYKLFYGNNSNLEYGSPFRQLVRIT